MRQPLIRYSLGAIGLALIVAATAVSAQQPQTVRVRGTIEKVDGNTLTVKARDGANLTIKLADNARVSALVKASLADIKVDSFIGVAGIPEADGRVKAFSVHIFLSAQRGVVPDRHGPWDARPGSTMTNAYVENTVTSKDGATLMVKYKEGEKKIVVTPETVIAAVAPGDKSELKTGAQIIIFASDKHPDGSLLAKTMYIGRNVAPAM
jgi:hypothetical protein